MMPVLRARLLTLLLIVAQAMAGAAPRVLCLTWGDCREPAPVEACCGSCVQAPAAAADFGSIAGADHAEHQASKCRDDCGCCVALTADDRLPTAPLPKAESCGAAAPATPAIPAWVGADGLRDPTAWARPPEPLPRSPHPGLRSTHLLL